MQTSELTGLALDWAAHIAQGLSEEAFVIVDNLYGPQWRGPEYSKSWQEGGPIIERERISVDYSRMHEDWQAAYHHGQRAHLQVGPTPLIAAMRCFVASRLGDTVDIPEELK